MSRIVLLENKLLDFLAENIKYSMNRNAQGDN